MNIDLTDNPVRLSMKIARVCDPYTAVLYSVLLEGSKNGIAEISKTELSKITNIPKRSLTTKITKLSELGLINVELENGNVTRYHVKNIFEDAASEQPPANSSRQEPEQQKSEPTPPMKVPKGKRYQMPYYVMLDAIGSSLAEDMPLSESDVDNLTDDRETEMCTIPSNWAFSDDQKTVEDALKYLAYYSQIKSGQKKDFVESTIIALSESICTGMKNTVHGCNPETIISRLNTIIHSPDINLGQWLNDFARVFSEKFDGESKRIYNYYAYLKTAAINYLTEYKSQVYNGFYEDE